MGDLQDHIGDLCTQDKTNGGFVEKPGQEDTSKVKPDFEKIKSGLTTLLSDDEKSSGPGRVLTAATNALTQLNMDGSSIKTICKYYFQAINCSLRYNIQGVSSNTNIEPVGDGKCREDADYYNSN